MAVINFAEADWPRSLEVHHTTMMVSVRGRGGGGSPIGHGVMICATAGRPQKIILACFVRLRFDDSVD